MKKTVTRVMKSSQMSQTLRAVRKLSDSESEEERVCTVLLSQNI